MAKSYLDYIPILGPLNRNLMGASDEVLSGILLVLALVCVMLAVTAPPVLKASALAWFLFP